MAKHIEIGKKGEEIAKSFLKKKGYLILETNYRVRHMEIDIIAKINNQLVVIEVKTRQSTYLSEPLYTVSKAKQKLIIKATQEYIIKNQIDLYCQFDIISILFVNNRTKVVHLEDAFYAL